MFVIISFTVFLRAVHAIQNCQNNICLNGGTCEVIESEKTFRCACNQGYFGIICELACDTSCKNGGKCIASKCVCPEGFTGSTCEDEIIDCAVQGCEPGERCVQSGDSAICAIDPCSPNPCSNNANCFAAYNKTSADDESNYFCECPSGFSGEHCENDINECTSNRCLNNGICINSIGSFTCACINGFTGDHCQTSSACQGASCLNGGTCQQTEYGYKCICSPGYTSANCEKRISIHEDMTCNCPDELHECIKGQCFCADKTQKGKCDKVDNCISPNFCLNGGVCRNDTTKCVCSYGFEGVRCQHSIHCYVNGRKCVHGKCVRMLNSTECLCDEGYFGDLCENTNIIYEPCDTINCNGGTMKCGA